MFDNSENRRQQWMRGAAEQQISSAAKQQMRGMRGGAAAAPTATAHSRAHALLLTILTALATIAAVLPFTATPSALADELDQVVGENETLSHDQVEIGQGHMDIGPRVIDGKWTLAVRDDSRETPAWRLPQDIVFRVGSKSILHVPDSGDYDFTGAQAGSEAYVIPQSQLPGVPWLGWNTQAPEVTKLISRGINLTFLGAQGPGNLNVFLESGNFSKPTQLWDARNPKPQPIWVDLHTHTHATWVFTKPGVYTVTMNASATGLDGRKHSATSVFRFAVGDQVSAQQARAAKWQGEIPSAEGVASALAGGAAAGAASTAEGAGSDANVTAEDKGASSAESAAAKPSAEPVKTPEIVTNDPASEGLGTGTLVALIVGGLVVIGGIVFVSLRRGRAAKLEAAKLEAAKLEATNPEAGDPESAGQNPANSKNPQNPGDAQ